MKNYLETERQLMTLENKIRREYSAKWRLIYKKSKKYLDKIEKQYDEKKKQLDDGRLSKDEFILWYKNLFDSDEKWQKTEEYIASLISDAEDSSVALINALSPRVFVKAWENNIYGNVGSERKWIEDLLRDNNAKEILKSLPDALYRINVINKEKAIAWNKRMIDKAVLQANTRRIEPSKILDGIQHTLQSSMAAAIRNAKTTISSANNSAKQELCNLAAKRGIFFEKEWVSVMDDKTRGSHILLDGTIIRYNEKFLTSNGNELRFPCDPAAPPSEVYNCRCAMKMRVANIDKDGIEEVRKK